VKIETLKRQKLSHKSKNAHLCRKLLTHQEFGHFGTVVEGPDGCNI